MVVANAVSVWEAYERAGTLDAMRSLCPHCGANTRWECPEALQVCGALVPAVGRHEALLGLIEVAQCSSCHGLVIAFTDNTSSLKCGLGELRRPRAVVYPPDPRASAAQGRPGCTGGAFPIGEAREQAATEARRAMPKERRA